MATITLKTLQKEQIQGSPYGTQQYWQLAVFGGDASYPSGGYPVTPSLVGFNSVLGAFEVGTSGAESAIAKYDATNNTIRFYYVAAGTLTEVTATNSVATATPTFMFIGS